jgi:hypothetical protein
MPMDVGGSKAAKPPAASSGSDYNWGRTIGISVASIAAVFCLAGLGVVAVRQHRTQPGV